MILKLASEHHHQHCSNKLFFLIGICLSISMLNRLYSNRLLCLLSWWFKYLVLGTYCLRVLGLFIGEFKVDKWPSCRLSEPSAALLMCRSVLCVFLLTLNNLMFAYIRNMLLEWDSDSRKRFSRLVSKKQYFIWCLIIFISHSFIYYLT